MPRISIPSSQPLAAILVAFALAVAVGVPGVRAGEVGLCQSEDLRQKNLDAAKATEDGAKQKKVDAEREAFMAAWKQIRADRAAGRAPSVTLPKSDRTQLLAIEAKRDEKTAAYFAAKRRAKTAEGKLVRAVAALDDARAVAAMGERDCEDGLAALDYPRLLALGLPDVGSPDDFDPAVLDDLVAERTARRAALERQKVQETAAVTAARRGCDAAYDYVALRVRRDGGAGAWPTATTELQAGFDAASGRFDELYEATVGDGERLKVARAAMAATTAPTEAQRTEVTSLEAKLRTGVASLQSASLAAGLARRELDELAARRTLFDAQVKAAATVEAMGRLEAEIRELRTARVAAAAYVLAREDARNYREDAQRYDAERRGLEAEVATARRAVDDLERQLKALVDEQMRVLDEMRRAERGGVASQLLAMVKDWLTKGAAWFWDRIKELPFLVAALAWMNNATTGYFLEILKVVAMLVVGFVTDVVFVAFPLTGMMVGFAIGQIDGWYTGAQTPPQPEKLEMVVTLTEDARRFYFMAGDGDESTAETMARMLDEYERLVGSLSKGHAAAMDRERVRVARLDAVLVEAGQVRGEVESATTRRDEALTRLASAKAESRAADGKLQPLRDLLREDQRLRARLYTIRRELAGEGVALGAATALAAEAEAAVAKLKDVGGRLAETAASAAVTAATAERRRADDDQRAAAADASAAVELMRTGIRRLEALQADAAVLRSGRTPGIGPDGSPLPTVSVSEAALTTPPPLLAIGDSPLTTPLAMIETPAGLAGAFVKGEWDGWKKSHVQIVAQMLVPQDLLDKDKAEQIAELTGLRSRIGFVLDESLAWHTEYVEKKIIPALTVVDTGVATVEQVADMVTDTVSLARLGEWYRTEIRLGERSRNALKQLRELDVAGRCADILALLKRAKDRSSELAGAVAVFAEHAARGTRGAVDESMRGMERLSRELREDMRTLRTKLDDVLERATRRLDDAAAASRVWSEAFGETLEACGDLRILGEGAQCLKRFAGSARAVGRASLDRVKDVSIRILRSPATVLDGLSEVQAFNIGYVASETRKNMAGVYVSILYSLMELYGLLDFDDPCFPPQPLLPADEATLAPVAEPVVVPVPAGDTWKGWIEVHDVTSGLNPLSMSLTVKDLTGGTGAPYARGVDLFGKGTSALAGLGESPLHEERRGKGLTVLQEDTHRHLDIPFVGLVKTVIDGLLSFAGATAWKGSSSGALFLENKIKRARFAVEFDLKGSLGHVLELRPFIHDRAGRPSASRAYRIKFVRDDEAPSVRLVAPAALGSDEPVRLPSPVTFGFVVTDVLKDRDSASGVPLRQVRATLLRHGQELASFVPEAKDVRSGKPVPVPRAGGPTAATTAPAEPAELMILDPVEFAMTRALPDGAYELRLEARDRSGNGTVNGVARTEGTTPPKFLFTVGEPGEVVVQPSPDRPGPYGAGETVGLTLALTNNVAGATVESIRYRLLPGEWKGLLNTKVLAGWLGEPRVLDLKKVPQRGGRGLVLPETVPLTVLAKQQFDQGTQAMLRFEAFVKLTGRPKEIPADFVFIMPIGGRLAPSELLFEASILYRHGRGAAQVESPLPYGTKVAVTQIYSMPLVGMGSSGTLQAGGHKFVEQFVGYGEVDDTTGHVLVRVRPVGSKAGSRFRVVADSMATTKRDGGGRRGIGAVVGLRNNVPYRMVGLPFDPTPETVQDGTVRFLRPSGPVVIPGAGDAPVPLAYEGDLTTGGFINPWGDVSGGGVSAAASFTMVGQMANLAQVAADKTPEGGIPTLLWRNHSDAFTVLDAIVTGWRFASSLSRVDSSAALRRELGDDFVPLLPEDTSSASPAYAADPAAPGPDGASAPTGTGASARDPVGDAARRALVEHLRRGTASDVAMADLAGQVLDLSADLQDATERVASLTLEIETLKGRRDALTGRRDGLAPLEEVLKAQLFTVESERIPAAFEAGELARLQAVAAALSSRVDAVGLERSWLGRTLDELAATLETMERELVQARQQVSDALARLVERRTALAAAAREAKLDPAALADLMPGRRFRDFADFLPPDEKAERKRELAVEFFLAQARGRRIRSELRQVPLKAPGAREDGVPGVTARWHPAASDDEGFALYAPDKDGVRRILVPPGKGRDGECPHRILRAYGAFVRELFVPAAGDRPTYRWFEPKASSSANLAITRAWDEAFDTFFATAAAGVGRFDDVVAGERLDYGQVLGSLSGDPRKLRDRFNRRGLDNPTAVATMFWQLWDGFGREFMANVLGYGERLHVPRLVGWYPERRSDFLALGLVPSLTFETGPTGLPRISWDDNGILRDARELRFVVEYSPDPAFQTNVTEVEPRGGTSIDFGAALDPDQADVVLRNRLPDGAYYFRVRLDDSFAGGILGRACSPTGAFTVKRATTTVGPGGGSVPFGGGGLGGSLNVDAGALGADVALSATPVGLPRDLGGYHVVGGTAMDLQPDDVTYERAAQVVFTYDDRDLGRVNEGDLFVGRYDETRGMWVPVPTAADPSKNVLTASTTHHSLYAVLVDTQPPSMVGATDGPDPFDPMATVVRIRCRASEPAAFAVRVLDASGAEVRRLEAPLSLTGEAEVAWDGRSSTGTVLADGVYRYEVTARDASGKVSPPLEGKVFVLAGPGGTLRGRVSVVGRPDASAVVVAVDGTTLAVNAAPDGAFELLRVPPCVVDVTASLTSHFPSSWSAVAVAESAVTTLAELEITSTVVTARHLEPRYVTPDGDGVNDDLVLTVTLSKAVPLAADVLDAGGRVVARPMGRTLVGPGAVSVVWDGRGADGVVEGNGPHTVRLTAWAGEQALVQGEEPFVLDTGLARDMVVDPFIVSPNDDGWDDEAAVMYMMTSTGTVTVEVLDGGGAPVRTLATDVPVEPGSRTLGWRGDGDDGRPLPDGRYLVRLSSRHPDATPSVSFERPVILDRTAPVLEELAPANGMTLTTGMPCISARVVASPGDVPFEGVRVKVDEHTVEPDSYDPTTGRVTFTPKTSLGSGLHIAIVYARDLAGNEAPPAAAAFRVDFGTEADRTPPSAVILGPAVDGRVFRPDPGLEVLLHDAASGIDPDSIVLTVDGERVANAVTLYIPGTSGKAWDMWFYEKMKVLYDPLTGRMRYNCLDELKRKDQLLGTHTWSVVASDRVGNRAVEVHGRFGVELDEGAPELQLLEPAEGALVTGRRPRVVLRATDVGPSGVDPTDAILAVDGEVLPPADPAVVWTAQWKLPDEVATARLAGRELGLPAAGTPPRVLRAPVTAGALEVAPVEIVAFSSEGRLLAGRVARRFVTLADAEGGVLAEELTWERPDLPADERPGFRLLRGGSPLVPRESSYDPALRRARLVVDAVVGGGDAAVVELSDGAGRLTGRVLPAYELVWQPPSPLANDADHALVATIRDRADNRSEPLVATFRVVADETAPRVVWLDPADGAVLRPNGGPVAVTVVVDERGGSGIDPSSLRVAFDGRPLEDATLDSSGTGAATLPGGLTEGRHLLTVSVADRAGNVAGRASAELFVTADASPPRVVSFEPLHGSAVDGSSVRVSAVLADAGAGLDAGSVVLTLDGTPVPPSRCSFDPGTGRLQASLELPADGRRHHVLGLTVRDRGGNELREPFISVVTSRKGGGAR